MTIEESFELFKTSETKNTREAYFGHSGCPCGRSREEGNMRILTNVSLGRKDADESLHLQAHYSTYEVEVFIRRRARKVIRNFNPRHDRWGLEVPVLAAIERLREMNCVANISAKTISEAFNLSIPRAEYVLEKL